MKSVKSMYTFIIILVILFLFMYSKSLSEFFYFDYDNNIEINLNLKNNILWLSKNLEDVTQLNKGTFIYQTNKLVYSNEKITPNFKYSGFIFKPEKNLKNLKIGLKNKDNDYFSYCFDIKENKILQIVEDNKIQDINFCSITPFKKCFLKKDVYQFNINDYLGIIIDNNIINYLIIKKNEGVFNGNIIHKSINSPIYPLQATIINDQNDNLIEKSYWINNKYSYDTNVWIVEDKTLYEDAKLPPQITPEKPIEDKYNLEIIPKDLKLSNKNRILITDYEIIGDNLKLTTINNLTENNIKYLRKIMINLAYNNKVLSIPINQDVIDNIEVNLAKYKTYLNNIMKVNIELIRSNIETNNNFISNTIEVKIK